MAHILTYFYVSISNFLEILVKIELGNLTILSTDALECKRAVKWICDYICYQCSRPPPAHSKDLHSTIVAAFQCTSAWLMQHPYLLQDKDCLTTVMEVVELGISGSKSVGKAGDAPKFKDDKELKPASMRVRDAAEHLLTIILEQVGYFPSECGPESISSLLDEVALIKHCNSTPASDNGNSISTEQAIQKFKYFVTENSTILALLEEPLGNDQDPQPTVTCKISKPIQAFQFSPVNVLYSAMHAIQIYLIFHITSLKLDSKYKSIFSAMFRRAALKFLVLMFSRLSDFSLSFYRWIIFNFILLSLKKSIIFY